MEKGGPALGASTICCYPWTIRTISLNATTTINEEAVTLEDVYEPYLMQIGFLTRTPRGRCVTAKAYEHLGLRFPGSGEMEQMTL